jgi:predicted TIM-barrel fold metal-dependent hydrolase
MINGTFRAFPKIHFIFAHGGGVMPLILERLEGFKDWDAVGPGKLSEMVPDGMTNEFRRCYFEIAQAFTPASFGALAKIVPASQILFGSDTPFFPISHSAKGIDSLDISAKFKRAINRTNGEALLPQLRR